MRPTPDRARTVTRRRVSQQRAAGPIRRQRTHVTTATVTIGPAADRSRMGCIKSASDPCHRKRAGEPQGWDCSLGAVQDKVNMMVTLILVVRCARTIYLRSDPVVSCARYRRLRSPPIRFVRLRHRVLKRIVMRHAGLRQRTIAASGALSNSPGPDRRVRVTTLRSRRSGGCAPLLEP